MVAATRGRQKVGYTYLHSTDDGLSRLAYTEALAVAVHVVFDAAGARWGPLVALWLEVPPLP
ncbi:hypothetical protein [Cutibacterium sp.]|uniref:hypothetical protein n=1 Tax=Cutibacterium sp. TaxID=1912221 RepID=UPI0026DD626E|nr:hypothetical protein [Cutibacterium sp.]MDO4412306.1 hypothetical protein [Cutibacterium sp.]